MIRTRFYPAILAIGLMAATPSAQNSTIPKNNNAFAFDLYHELNEATEGNIFFSPFSISTALAMTYAGAAGNTASEMASTMHFDENNKLFHHDYSTYLNSLNENADGTIQLNIANKIWGEQTFKLNQDFLHTTRYLYQSPLEQVNFIGHPDQERKRINGWVQTKTEGKIVDLLPEGVITTDTRLVLTNAIYFKADWQIEFDTLMTYDQLFHLSESDQKSTSFMHRTDRFQYADVAKGKFIKLDYKGRKHSMVLALPSVHKDMAWLEEYVAKNGFDKVLNAPQQQVQLALPKFKLTQPLGLKKNIQDMGMKQAFSMAADFSKMMDQEHLKKHPDQNLFISDVLHKAFIEIDEKGTEAAAATAVVMQIESTSVQPRIQYQSFIADHPFLFYIVDNESGSILFMGKITNPKMD